MHVSAVHTLHNMKLKTLVVFHFHEIQHRNTNMKCQGMHYTSTLISPNVTSPLVKHIPQSHGRLMSRTNSA